MKLIDIATNILSTLGRKRLDSTSLQLRLTLGITTVSLLGLGAVGTWTTWEMRQMLVVQHEEQVQFIAERLPQDVADSTTFQMAAQHLPTIIERWSAPGLRIWVKQSNGTLVTSARNSPTQVNLAMDAVPVLPSHVQVHEMDGRFWVGCTRPLQVKGQRLGQLYVVQDITHDYTVLTTLIRSLMGAAGLAILTIGMLVALLVRRSLRPLHRMNQLVTGQRSLTPATLEEMPSEMKALAHAFSTLLNRMSESGEQQRQFTNSMSHELRTSLSLVYGYLQSSLRRCNNLTDPQREALQVAASETERTIQLLEDLLDLARVQNGSMEFQTEYLVLNDVVHSAADRLKAKPNPPLLDLNLPNDLVVAKADRKQLRRVLLHLLENAARYGYQAEPIRLSLTQQQDWAFIQVSDRGCGIPSTDQARIFEPFYRVDASRCRTTGGVGLGLAIVKALVEGMGGQVTVQSIVSKGSTFTVMLPAVREG